MCFPLEQRIYRQSLLLAGGVLIGPFPALGVKHIGPFQALQLTAAQTYVQNLCASLVLSGAISPRLPFDHYRQAASRRWAQRQCS